MSIIYRPRDLTPEQLGQSVTVTHPESGRTITDTLTALGFRLDRGVLYARLQFANQPHEVELTGQHPVFVHAANSDELLIVAQDNYRTPDGRFYVSRHDDGSWHIVDTTLSNADEDHLTYAYSQAEAQAAIRARYAKATYTRPEGDQ